MRGIHLAAAALAALAAAGSASAQRPDTAQGGSSGLFPQGGQRGTEVAVEWRGRYLFDPLGVVVRPPDPAVGQPQLGAAEDAIALVSTEGRAIQGNDDGRKVTMLLRIHEQAPMGLYALRLRTAHGLGPLHLFHVGVMDEVRETVRESGAPPQTLSLERTVNGVLRAGERDTFAIGLAAGVRVRCEVQATRLGGSARDLTLTIVGPVGPGGQGGDEVLFADDTPLGGKDPLGWFEVPADGTYLVHLDGAVPSETAIRSYRLHIGTFPRPTMVSPLGGLPGASLDVTLSGDPDLASATIELPRGGGRAAYFPEHNGRIAPTSLLLLRSGAQPPVVDLREGQVDDKKRPLPPLYHAPGVLHGVIGAPGETDSYTFLGKKDDRWNLRLRAREYNSPLDGEIHIYDPTRRWRAGNDDGRGTGADPFIAYKVPSDGEYRVDVRDLMQRGGAEFSYRLEVTREADAKVDEGDDRYGTRLNVPVTGGDTTFAVPRGGYRGHVLVVNSYDNKFPIQALMEGLPDGVTAAMGRYCGDTPYLPVVLHATEDAPLAATFAQPAAATGRAPGYLQRIPVVRTRNNLPFAERIEYRIPVAVTEAPPFSVEFAEFPTTRVIVPGSYLKIPVAAQRNEGYTGAVRVSMLWSPPGLSAGSTTINGDKDRGAIYLNARGDCRPGEWPIALRATANVRGGTHEVSTAMQQLNVVPRWVTAKGDRLRLEPGDEAALKVTLDWQRQDELLSDQPVTVYLNGLPKGIAAQSVTAKVGDREVTFAVRVSAACAPGRSRPSVRVAVPTVHGAIIHQDYGTEIRIDRPSTRQQQAAPEKPPAKDGSP